MKKYIYNIYLLAALFLVATACTKEDSMLDSSAVEKEQPVNKTYTLTVNASKGEDIATTRALTLDGTTLNSTWEVNDEVTVYNVTKSAELGGTLKAQSAGTSTTLTGTLTGTIENGDELTLKFHSPSYASQDGTLDYIAANCDYATANVTVSSVVGGNVTTDAAHFVNQQAIVKFTLKDKNGGALLDGTTKLAVTVGSNSYTITPASATSTLYVAIPGISGQSITLNAVVGTKIYTFTNASATFANSKYYTVGVWMTHQGTIEIGKLIGQNGCIYANAAAATSAGTTAAGMIAYIGSASNCTNGLAIALADDGDKSLEGATNAAAAKNRSTGLPVVGGTWRVPTKADWEHMLTACGDSYDGANWTTSGLRGKLQTVYADIVMGNSYWANTPYPYSSGNSYRLYNGDPSGASFQYQSTTESIKVRAVLAF